MPDTLPADSVGIVTPQTYHFDAPIDLACGQTLENYDLVVETYGTLNADASNAVSYLPCLEWPPPCRRLSFR